LWVDGIAPKGEGTFAVLTRINDATDRGLYVLDG
jgi:hypothetical protein